MKRLYTITAVVSVAALLVGSALGAFISATMNPLPVHAQSFGVTPIASAATASACTSPASGWLLCGYGAGTVASPYGLCASFNGGACNAITSAPITISATAPISVSGNVISCPTCATTPISIPFSQITGQIAPSQVPPISTTVTSTSTAITTVQ